MIRINRLTDYGIVLLTHIASQPEDEPSNARDLAREAHLPMPAVSKILKLLTREGLLDSQRGAKGGYRLARRAEKITVAAIIRALEGPIGITECTMDHEGERVGECGNLHVCPVHGNWQEINKVVERALESISLRDMVRPADACVAVPEDFLKNVTIPNAS
ncbi:MAG: SUF system Fe-S cluster assembly regulator [Deltaproteobacteria bacterium]|nr:SUF system Fe-S cluster assembly regulator [Deltaproteobacteria bacterium]